MAEEEKARQSLLGLRKFLPLEAYLYLDGHAAEATITEFPALKGKFKIGVVVKWNGQDYNPNTAGAAISNDLREYYKLDQSKPSTVPFGGWHRLRVSVSNQLYRLDEFLTTDVRRGNQIFNAKKLSTNPTQHETLKAILDSAAEVYKGGTVYNEKVLTQPAHCQNESLYQRLLPYLTTLYYYFKTADFATMLTKLRDTDVETLIMVTGADYKSVLQPVLRAFT